MSKKIKFFYIATVQDNKKLKYGLINHIGDWIIQPKYQLMVKLGIKDYYSFYEDMFCGIIDTDENVIINPKFEQIELLNDEFLVTINDKKGIIDKNQEYLIQPIYDSIEYYDIDNLFYVEIDRKFGLINSDYINLIKPKYRSISKSDNEGFIKVNFDEKIGFIDSIDNILIDFKFQLIEDFDDNGFAIAKENNKYGFINRRGEWIIYPTYSSVSNFNIRNFSCVSIGSNFGVIDLDGKWVIQPKFRDCKTTIDDNCFIVCLNHKYGIIDVDEKWIIEPIYDSLRSFDINGFAIASIDHNYGIIDKNFAWVIEPQFNYISDFNEFGQYRIHLSNKMGIIDTKNKGIILEPIFENILQFPEHNHIFKVFIDGKYLLINKEGKVLLEAILNKLNTFNEKGIAIAQLQKNKKWGIINTSGEWILYPVYDELENIDEFGYLKATLNSKYGWIDTKGNWVINPVFDIKIYSELVEEKSDIENLIDDTFRDSDKDLKNVFLYDKIPELLKSTYNENLDIEFKENIDYIIFCDDSIEGDGSDGIAIVKKRDNYYLILKEHRKKPVIFFLYSKFERWEIKLFSLDSDDYKISIATTPDAKVINGENFYCIDSEKNPQFEIVKIYIFRFYNMLFLELLIEICERINDELD